MNVKYILIGVGLLAGGILIAVKELRAFFKELKEEDGKTFVIIKGAIDSLFLGGLGFAGVFNLDPYILRTVLHG